MIEGCILNKMIKYIYAFEPNKNLGSGMENKVNGQVNALKNNGLDVIKEGHCKPSKYIRMIPFMTSSINWNKIDLTNVDGLYIRYLMSDFQFIKFLKRAKKNHIRICIEVATYPYKKELSWYSIKTIRDCFYKILLYKYVDLVFFMGGVGNVENIFGIRSKKICNGIDFNKYKIHNNTIVTNTIRLIAVADFDKRHGYERILKGISEYKKNGGKRIIDFYMVGEGSEKSFYEKLSINLGIDNNVHFLGRLIGKDLDLAYDSADIGVEVFGFYKNGIKCSSSLKSREYLARGLPFICGAKNDLIPEDFPYCLFFENDDSVVDIGRVVDFFDRIYDKENSFNVSSAIRNYGINNASWEKTMKPVSDFFTRGE